MRSRALVSSTAGAFTALLLLAPVAAWADTLELTTGERIEGTGVRASPDHVTIELGGRTLIFDRSQVRAIYFGAPPARCR